jgi:membrane-associated phospholipid phosphatase
VDDALFQTLQHTCLALLPVGFWSAVTSLLTPALILATTAAHRRRAIPWQLLATAVLAGLLAESTSSHLLKPLFGIARPCLTPGLSELAACSATLAMPSSHACSMAAGLAILWPANRRLAPIYAPLAAFYLLSRIALGLHRPSELLAGAVCGVLIGAAVGWAVLRFTRA